MSKIITLTGVDPSIARCIQAICDLDVEAIEQATERIRAKTARIRTDAARRRRAHLTLLPPIKEEK